MSDVETLNAPGNIATPVTGEPVEATPATGDQGAKATPAAEDPGWQGKQSGSAGRPGQRA